MEQNNSLIINFTKQELKDIESFCKLNELEKEKFIKGCFMQGYYIEKHGFLGKMGGVQEKWVEKEVIREKRVEIPIEIIKEVEKEVIKEIIKEVPIEKVVEKIVEITKEIPVEKVVIKEIIKDRHIPKLILTQVLRESLWDNIKNNQVLTGKVKDVKQFGTLVNLDDETVGLIHTSEMEKLKSKFQSGQEIKVKVLSVDRSSRKIFLTLA